MEKLWNNSSIGLIGRRSLLERQIQPRVNNPALRFYLAGPAQVGKTALLEAAYELCTAEKKSFVYGGKAHAEICKQLIKDWRIEVDAARSNPTAAEMEEALLGSEGHMIFIDNLHRLSSVKKLDFFKAMADRHKVVGTLQSGAAKENLKPLLAKLGKEISIPKLTKHDALRLAQRVCIHFSSRLEFKAVANAAGGLPGKIVTYAKANEIQRNEIKSAEEEIDISPLFLMGIAALVIFRYIGRTIDATDFTLIGGTAVVLMIFAKGVFSKGRNT